MFHLKSLDLWKAIFIMKFFGYFEVCYIISFLLIYYRSFYFPISVVFSPLHLLRDEILGDDISWSDSNLWFDAKHDLETCQRSWHELLKFWPCWRLKGPKIKDPKIRFIRNIRDFVPKYRAEGNEKDFGLTMYCTRCFILF